MADSMPGRREARRVPGPIQRVRCIADGEWSDLWRGRFLPAVAGVWLAICLVATSAAISAVAGAAPGLAVAAATLVDIALLVVPLLGAVTGAVAFSSDGDAIEVLLLQPVSRSTLWVGRLVGQGSALLAALAPGWLATFIWLRRADSGAGTGVFVLVTLLSAAIALIFLVLGALAGALWRDRMRAIGSALALWAGLTVLWDALLMGLALGASSAWFEAALPGLVLLSPVDAVRIAYLVASNSRAFSGPAGAALAWFFSAPAGSAILAAALLVWLAVPALLGMWCWSRQDL